MGKQRFIQSPKKGKYLLSGPFLPDPNFRRAVVLLTEHNEGGSIGFVLNKPIEQRLNQILPDFPALDFPVFLGGPVQQDSLHFIHRVKEIAGEDDEIAPGVYWGSDFDRLRSLAETGSIGIDDIRFFIGYSGWGPEQLEKEIKGNSWIISPSKASFTFANDAGNLWRNILRAMGNEYKLISNAPPDPSLN